MTRGSKTKALWQNPEYREHMKKVHMGKVGYWKNKERTQETREKIRTALTGYKHTDEFKEKIRIATTGRKHTLESRKKMSRNQRSGENHPWWKGGVSKENDKIRRGIEFKYWRERVFERDDWTCQECGVRGGELHPHHIKSFAEFRELRFDIDNGITLCAPCHRKTDSWGKNKHLAVV